MGLDPGIQLGPYQVIAQLGAGGMGEVYRAEDTVLKREVALKVLPQRFTRDPQMLARLKREAQLLASLNHANIAAIHTFEQADGVHFLVLELVEGETLAERLKKGALCVSESLEICRQIAEGLAAAHERGVIHRDLKPANIKITPKGQVKILDFGLAKLLEEEVPARDISNSPTLSAEMTRAGVILGTAAYMSPEQAAGKPLDQRADIWAFGCVLYECLTGRKAFEGKDLIEVLAALLKLEPDWQALPPGLSAGIRTLLSRCLHKDARYRFHSAADLGILVEEALAVHSEPAPSALPGKGQRMLSWGFGFFLGLVAGAGFWFFYAESGPEKAVPVTRLSLNLSPESPLMTQLRPNFCISPEGKRLAYVGVVGGIRKLFIRPMDRSEARPVDGTELALSPVFSPDGQWVAFYTEDKLKRVPVTGGAPVTLAEEVEYGGFGLDWGDDGNIVFAPTFQTGLLRVSATGGKPVPLTTLKREAGEAGHHWPDVLPGGKGVLFTIVPEGVASWDESFIALQAGDDGERRILLKGGSHPRYVPTGHLVYTRGASLMAVPFDLQKLEVKGIPVSVLEGVRQSSIGYSHSSFSLSGELYYRAGGVLGMQRRLVIRDSAGAVEVLPIQADFYLVPRLSPDGKRVAAWLAKASRCDIVVADVLGTVWSRLTFEADNPIPFWTPDGSRVTFQSNRSGAYNIFWLPADGS